jgi:phosphoribosylformylglycinamidine (FGAM) synthase-like enzyme
MEVFKKYIENALHNKLTRNEHEIYKHLLDLAINDGTSIQHNLQVVSTKVTYNNEFDEARKFFQDTVLEGFNNGRNVRATIVFFSFPDFDSQGTKETLFNSIKGISGAASEMAIPVVSSNAKFSIQNKAPEIIIGTLAEKAYTEGTIKGNQLIVIEPDANPGKDDPMIKKMMLECISDINEVQNAKVYYSSENTAKILASVLHDNKYSIKININSSNFNSIRKPSENKIFVLSSNKEFNQIQRIAKNFGLKAQLFAEVETNQGAIIQEKNKSIKIKTDIIHHFISQNEYKKLTKPTETKYNLPPEVEVSKTMALKILDHPNLLSKKWVKEKFDRFIGNNNLSSNFHTDCPMVLVNGKEFITFTSNTNPEFVHNVENGIIHSIFDNFRRTISCGSRPEHCVINTILSEEELFSKKNKYENLLRKISSKLGFKSNLRLKVVDKKHNPCPSYSVVMMGNVTDMCNFTEYHFKNKGDIIFLLGKTQNALCRETSASSFIELKKIDLNEEIGIHKTLDQTIKYLITNRLINSAHNISFHGLFHSLIEASVPGKFGFDITTDGEIRTDIFLFSPFGSRVLVSISPKNEDNFIDYLVEQKLPFTLLGHVTKEELRIDDVSYGFISDVRKIYLKSFGKKFTNQLAN